ncbi:Dip2/Utp12 family-domain-containing protein [Nemania sp. NC0429]|nr:Dip2/Utp12 family-domain-containing protein [Nemania sp. NC0429]
MSTKRKAPAKIAHPVVKQSANKPFKPQVNESEAIVSIAGVSRGQRADGPGATDAIIEIPSDSESSDYDLSDHELNNIKVDAQPRDTEAAAQKPTASSSQKPSEDNGTDVPMADSTIPNDAESDQELAQPTLGELARAHGTIDVPSVLTPQSNAIVTQGQTIAPPSISSLGTVLSQALRTDDTDLLESCLRIYDGNTIDNTIQRLDSALAGILITKLASRIHRRPGRAGHLMTWVQATLVCHGGAFAAQPELVKRLSELQRVLDERARGLNSLLALKGKLDLMHAQLRLRRQQRKSEGGAGVQEDEGIIYVEGEDSDAEMVNGLMDLDDDEIPVTNGLLEEDSENDELESEVSDREEELDVEELDDDDVDYEDVESEEEDSEAEAAPEPPSKRSKPSRGR